MTLSTNLRVVIDSNVLISAVIWGGKPGRIIKRWREGLFTLFISPFILVEVAKFLEDYGITEEVRQKITDELKRKTTRIIPTRQVKITRDRKDNEILDLCLAAKADYLITGDKDLLVLKSFKKTKILSPKFFLKISLKKNKE